METFIFVMWINKRCSVNAYAHYSIFHFHDKIVSNYNIISKYFFVVVWLFCAIKMPFFICLHVHIYPTFGALFSGMIQRNLVRPEGPGAGASSLGESSSGLERALTKVRVFWNCNRKLKMGTFPKRPKILKYVLQARWFH